MTTQLERIAKMEQSLRDIKGDVKEIKVAVIGLDNRFAGKWTEWTSRMLVGAIVTFAVYVVVAMAGKAPHA